MESNIEAVESDILVYEPRLTFMKPALSQKDGNMELPSMRESQLALQSMKDSQLTSTPESNGC